MSEIKAFVAAVREHTGVEFSDDEVKRIEASCRKAAKPAAGKSVPKTSYGTGRSRDDKNPPAKKGHK